MSDSEMSDPQQSDPAGNNSRGLWSRLDVTGVLGGLMALLFAFLTLLTCIDVVSRYFFDSPLPGAFELTELTMGALIFTALPLTTLGREHVEVDLLAQFMTPPLLAKLRIVMDLVTAIILGVFAVLLVKHGLKLAGDGAATDALSLPIYPIAYLAALSCAASAFGLLALNLKRA
ncbi:TRAP transporter small permease [Rhodovibrionaceae bacterium A322]